MNKSVYQTKRERSDLYLSAMNQKACETMILNNLLPIYFRNPTKAEDMRQGIDMHVDTDHVTLAYRTRSHRYKYFYLGGFTLRDTEIPKVMAGNYAHYLFYALEHPTNVGELESGILIDMREVGWQLEAYPHLLDEATRNGSMVEFEYTVFPFKVVAGLYGLEYADLREDESADFVRKMTTGNSYAEHVQ